MKKRDRYEQFDQEPQADELARVRKKKQRKRFWQKVFALVLAGAVVWGLLFLRKDIARLDLGMHLGDLVASYASGDGFPVDLPAGQVLNTAPLGKDLVLMTDTALTVYNSQGKATGIYEHGCTNPICLTNGDRVLTYDRGGKRLQVNSRSGQLFDQTMDYTISAASIGASGHVAVVTDAKYYTNCITVYDQEYEEIYIRETAELITGVSLETKGGGMAVAGIDANGGRLDSTITLFDFTLEDPIAKIDVADQVILSMEYIGRESALLQVITDQQAFLADRQGKIVSTFGFDGLFVNRFANNREGGIFLLLDQLGDGNRLQLVSLDEELDLVKALPLQQRVQDMRLGDGFLCLFSGGNALCYSPLLEEIPSPGAEDWYHIQPAGQNLYGITADTIELLQIETLSAF